MRASTLFGMWVSNEYLLETRLALCFDQTSDCRPQHRECGHLAQLRAARSSRTISVDDFRVVHANLTGRNRVTTGRQVPYCLFTDPELARIGLSETEANAQGIPFRLCKVPMEANLRAEAFGTSRFHKGVGRG